MSEAIKIKEGGIDRSQNQINKLKTNTVGGGVCFWVPETERQTDDKRITENGTYTAEDDGLYGYDKIDVSVPNTGSMSGKGTDGNDYSIDVDDDGYIVETKIPSYIRIENLPVRLQYNEGDTIDYTGIFVGAYDANGERLYDVPFSELVFPVSVAHADGSGEKSATSDLETSLPQPIRINDTLTVKRTLDEREYVTTFKGDATYLARKQDAHNLNLCIALGKTLDVISMEVNGRPGYITPDHYTLYGKDVYRLSYNVQGDEIEGISYDGQTVDQNSEWTMLWGNITAGNTQRLQVEWNRPGDFKQLDDYFEITVQPVESGTAHGNEENNSGGFEGGGSEHGF